MKPLIPAVLWASLAIAGPAGAVPPAFQAVGDIAYLCGGIGSDERRALEALRGQARVEIVFASAQRGAYLSDVRLALRKDGTTGPEVEVVSNGPVCLVDAPPGRYRLEARLGDVVRRRTVTVPAGRSLSKVVVAFPDEPWDGIRASEEEKRQARTPD